MMMMSEGGENKLGTNVNFLLEEFGIAVNSGRSGVGVVSILTPLTPSLPPSSPPHSLPSSLSL